MMKWNNKLGGTSLCLKNVITWVENSNSYCAAMTTMIGRTSNIR